MTKGGMDSEVYRSGGGRGGNFQTIAFCIENVDKGQSDRLIKHNMSIKKVELSCLANGGQPEPLIEFEGSLIIVAVIDLLLLFMLCCCFCCFYC